MENLYIETLVKMIQEYPESFKIIPKDLQTEQMCLEAVSVKKFGCNIEFVDEKFQTDEVCITALENLRYGRSYIMDYIKHIKNLSDKILYYLCERGINILSDDVLKGKLSDDMINVALASKGVNIQYIDNPTEEQFNIAFNNNPTIIAYHCENFGINKETQTKELLKKAFKKPLDWRGKLECINQELLDDSDIERVLTKYPYNIESVNNITPKMVSIIIKKDIENFLFIPKKKQTPEILDVVIDYLTLNKSKLPYTHILKVWEKVDRDKLNEDAYKKYKEL